MNSLEPGAPMDSELAGNLDSLPPQEPLQEPPLEPAHFASLERWRPRRFWPQRAPSRRFTSTLLLSIALHAILFSLQFGDGDGLPGLSLPWKERRAEAPVLRMELESPPMPLPAPPLGAAALPTPPEPSTEAPSEPQSEAAQAPAEQPEA
ncbi:MAG: hypothetical protein ACK5O3_04480, partial [Burkholderiales bacterium]